MTIAVDAMGGEDSPLKIIQGIQLHSKNSEQVFYKIFGNQKEINNELKKFPLKNNYEIIHTENKIEDSDSALSAAKRGKDTSMWMSIQSVKNKEADIVLSAGNTGALFVIAKLNFEMIPNIDKPALSGLWPNKNE